MFSPLAMFPLISLMSVSTVTSTSTFGMPVLSDMLFMRSDLRRVNYFKMNVKTNLNVKHSFRKEKEILSKKFLFNFICCKIQCDITAKAAFLC